jgi:hypothetical protein
VDRRPAAKAVTDFVPGDALGPRRPTSSARPFDGNDRAGGYCPRPDRNPLVAIRRATDRTSGQHGDADTLPRLLTVVRK